MQFFINNVKGTVGGGLALLWLKCQPDWSREILEHLDGKNDQILVETFPESSLVLISIFGLNPEVKGEIQSATVRIKDGALIVDENLPRGSWSLLAAARDTKRTPLPQECLMGRYAVPA